MDIIKHYFLPNSTELKLCSKNVELCKHKIVSRKYNRGWWQSRLMTTPTQQSSPDTALPMFVTKQTSSPFITSYTPLFVASRNTSFSSSVNNKFSLHSTLNRNRQHLTNFTLENRLTCLNTEFQKRNGKLCTNIYVNNAKAHIVYILINKKWNNSALNCVAHSTFEGVSSDHRIVVAKIRLSLWRNVARTTTTVHYDWSLLNNRDIRNIC